jgi:hypothetical protein
MGKGLKQRLAVFVEDYPDGAPYALGDKIIIEIRCNYLKRYVTSEGFRVNRDSFEWVSDLKNSYINNKNL